MTDTTVYNPPPLHALPEQCYTIAEAARILALSQTTVRRLAARGELRAVGTGRLLRFTLRDIRAYQERGPR